MPRFIEITLEKRKVSCVAKLLDDDAPLTCEIVWNALPQTGDAWHAKYASNEVYCLLPPLKGDAPGRENSTLMPIPGDVVYFYFPAGHLAHRLREQLGLAGFPGFVDLAIFYGRNNFLFDPAVGPVPGNVFATIAENIEEMAAACQDVWRNGSAGERLTFSRRE
jgi:hypothetical protein